MPELVLRWGGGFLLAFPIPALLTWWLTTRWAWLGGIAGVVLWDLLGIAGVVLAFAMRAPREALPSDTYTVGSGLTETWVDVLLSLMHGWLLGWPFHAAVAAIGLLCVAGGFETRRRRAAAVRA